MAEPLLVLDDVRAGYGDSVVLEGVSLSVPENGSLAVLGRNGVGKSTLLLTIMGYTNTTRGRVLWRGEEITGRPPHRRARLGLGWVAQEREIFPSLSVEENLTVASRPGRWDLKAVYGLFPRLAERRSNMGNQLSGGEQQMLAIARALMTNPALLLLDEPAAGVPRDESKELFEVVSSLSRDISVLFIEHDMNFVFRFASRIIVMVGGRILLEGAPDEIAADPRVREVYLGKSHGARHG
jgi:branched-chain amino acid transport system ATP-binding protein